MNTRMTCPDAFFNTGKGAGDEGEDALARGTQEELRPPPDWWRRPVTCGDTGRGDRI